MNIVAGAKRAFCVGAILLFAGTSIQASEQDGEFYFGAMGTYIGADSDRRVDDEVAGGQIEFGYALSEHFNWEVDGQWLELTGDPGFPDVDQWSISTNLMNIYNRAGRFSPYLLAGLGWVNTDPKGFDGDDNLQLKGGVGLLTDLFNDRWTLRTEALARWEDLRGGNATDLLVNVGLQYAFALGSGGSRVVDADGDGIADDIDRCPGTRLGVAVDQYGCAKMADSDGDGVSDDKDACANTPAGVKVDARGCPMDSDGDGVSDDRDDCPNTVAGAKVNDRGCEMDGDGDGVVDRLDRCANTKAGVAVDVYGCEIKEEIRLPGVNFETNSDQLVSTAASVLNDAARTLEKNPSLVVEVAGHTDSDGDAGYNQNLSERRANTVRQYLIDRGVDASRLSSRGYGETQPVADNVTAEGKAANRRVVLRVISR